jgi:hypothetical protein
VLRFVVTSLRLAGTTVAFLVTFTLAYGLVMPASAAPPSDSSLSPSLAFLLMAVLETAVVGWLILRSRDDGWPLAGRMLLAYFGVQTFMPQSDSLLFQLNAGFAQHLPAAMVPRIVAAGLLQACLWIPLAVLTLGRWRRAASDAPPPSPIGGGIAKWLRAAVVYVVLYFTFGYFVAWRQPAVAAYYQGTDSGSFWHQMGAVLRNTPWLPAAQLLRGLLWTGLGLLVLRGLRGSLAEKALAVAALFAVVMDAGLLLPNPYMPEDVRMAHLVETASSDALFGAFLVWLFGRGG